MIRSLTNPLKPATYMRVQEKTTAKPFNISAIPSQHNYENALLWLEKWGKMQYGRQFNIHAEDKPILYRLLCYFLKDKPVAYRLGIDLDKGIMISGPVGVGKTSLMNLLRL